MATVLAVQDFTHERVLEGVRGVRAFNKGTVYTVTDEEYELLSAFSPNLCANEDGSSMAKEDVDDGLPSKTKAELVEIATAEGVTVDAKDTKATLIAAIRAKREEVAKANG